MFIFPSERTSFRHGLLGLALSLALAVPGSLRAQARQVVSSQIAVSSNEATLRLEFADGGRLEVAFRDGTVRLDGDSVGTYAAGGPVEGAWRELLGRAVSLDDGPLAEELRSWQPPGSLNGSDAELAAAVDRALEGSLSAPARTEPAESVSLDLTGMDSTQEALLSALLGRTDRLRDLAAALDGLTLDRVRVRVGRDVTVGAGERFEGSLVSVGGDVEVAGEVDGSVVVVDGNLRLLDGSRVTGDIRLSDARLFRDGGVVEGRVRTMPAEAPTATLEPDRMRSDIERRVRDELREELRSEIRGATRSTFRNPLRNLLQGIGGLIENVIGFAVLAGIGLAVIYFFRENLETVAATVRRDPGRSTVVGLAGAFLLLPVWILGLIALVVSIIGIPVAVAWIPLFPLAAALAAGLGYLAVALVVGDWVGERNIQGLEWIRGSNPFYRLAAGLAALMLAFAASNVAHMGGSWLDFLEGLFVTTGVIAAIAATVVGFGAVILTRGGREPMSASGFSGMDFRPSSWRSEPEPEEPGDPIGTEPPGPSESPDASEEDER